MIPLSPCEMNFQKGRSFSCAVLQCFQICHPETTLVVEGPAFVSSPRDRSSFDGSLPSIPLRSMLGYDVGRLPGLERRNIRPYAIAG